MTFLLTLSVLLVVGSRAANAQSQPDAVEPPPASSDESSLNEFGDDELDIEDIDLLNIEIPIVITAARREQKITTVPYAVSIITAEDIRQSGARSIPDALRLAPGMDVAELGFGNYGVSPRGFHGLLSGQTLVLVDGRQIFDSFFGGTWWGTWPFQLEDIERIEVIRGPGGVTWGANAAQGVINIITKDPADQLGLTVTGGGASRGTRKGHLGYALADDKLRLRVSGEYEASDGFREGGSWMAKLDDDYMAGRIGLHAVYEPGDDDTITLSAGSALLHNGFPPSPMSKLGPRNNASAEANYLLAKWAHRIESENAFELTGYVNDFRLKPGMLGADYRYQQLALQFGHTFKAADHHTLTWGIDTRTDITDTSNSDQPLTSDDFISTAIIGMYAQDEWQLAPKWTLNLGGRIDYEFYGGFQPSARVALSYEISDDSLLYGAVSRAFSVSPAAIRFTDISLLGGLARIRDDRELRPISLIAYELGHRGRFLDRLNTSLNLFWHEYDDLGALRTRLGPPGLLVMEWGDCASASTYGLELEADYELTKQLTLLGHYTFERLNWRSAVPFHMTDAISPPQHKLMLGARYNPTGDLHLSSHLYYVDTVKAPNPGNSSRPRHVAPYFRLDLRAEYELFNDQASLAVGVRNLLDPNHYEGGNSYFNDAEVPRMVYAEFRMTIK